MIQAQQSIIAEGIFNDALLAEHVLYNNKTVLTIVEIGATLSRTDWNDSATKIENAVIGDLANFSFRMTDVPNPQEGDVISYQGKKYYVSQVSLEDTVGGVVVVNAMRNGRAIGL